MAYELCLSCDKALPHAYDEHGMDILFCDDACKADFYYLDVLTLVDTLSIDQHVDGVHETHVLLWSDGSMTTQVRKIAPKSARRWDDEIPF